MQLSPPSLLFPPPSFLVYRDLQYGRNVKGSLGGDAEHWYYVRNTHNIRRVLDVLVTDIDPARCTACGKSM